MMLVTLLTYLSIGDKMIGYKVPPSQCLLGDSVITINLIPVEWMMNVAGVSKHSIDRIALALH